MRRVVNFTVNIASNASGAVTTQVDPSLALTGSSDWASIGALYTKMTPPRVKVSLFPFVYFTTTGSSNYFGNMVTYYDPTAAAITTTYVAALDFRGALMYNAAKPLTYELQLSNSKGTMTPIILSDYVANFLGLLNFVAPNSAFANSVSVALLVLSFSCDFSSQK